MSTLNELKKQNEKLRNQLKARAELEEIGRERNKLMKENKNLLFAMKHKGLLSSAKKLSSFGQKSGVIGKKVGIGIWKKLRELEKTRLRNEALQRKLSRRRKR